MGHHHHHHDEEVERRVNIALSALIQFYDVRIQYALKELRKMTPEDQALEDVVTRLHADYTAQQNIVASAVARLQATPAASSDPVVASVTADLSSLASAMEASTQSLSAIVGTPTGTAPTPPTSTPAPTPSPTAPATAGAAATVTETPATPSPTTGLASNTTTVPTP